jgi:predicted transcriptional regulator
MVNETINNKWLKQIQVIIENDYAGSSLTELTKQTKLKRCQIRILIAYLLGQDKIKEQLYGMTKVYYPNGKRN